MTPSAPPTLDSGRNPFELWVLGFGLVIGAPLLFGAPAPGSTTEALGTVLVRVWAWLLVLGCVTAGIGALWTWLAWIPGAYWRPTTMSGLLIEEVGLVAVGAGTIVYAAGVIDSGGSRAAIAAALLTGWATACFWRVYLIRRWTRATVRSVQETDG